MLKSLLRAAPRLLTLLLFAMVNLGLSEYLPLFFGPTLTPVMFGIGLTFLGLAVGDIALRVLQPDVDVQMYAQEAMENQSTAAGLVYLGRCVLAGIILALTVTASRAETVPINATKYLPVLLNEQSSYWSDLKTPSVLASQVEQETCISLKHAKCWSPTAELRTSREQGIGLGQLTRTFRADGSTRFDSLTEITQQHPKELAGLNWGNRYDAKLQLRALVLKDRGLYKQFYQTPRIDDRLAFTFAAYNGGYGGVQSDKKVCAGTKGCDSSLWFANVERTSLKNKTHVPGYGKSFFEINREYVTNILVLRRNKYRYVDAA
jgi:hypothetical protein